MVDTIKFFIPLDKEKLSILKSKAIEFSKYSHTDEKFRFNFFTIDFKNGSFERAVKISIFDRDITVEFSLPKYIYNHNVYLLYPDQIKTAVDKFRRDFAGSFILLPDIFEWQVVRLDLCYAWKYIDEKAARETLDVLKSLDFGRKKKYIYPTSLMFKGTTYSIKFYLKKVEYYEHDFKILKNSDLDLAYRLLNNSSGVLRFEVTLRKKALQKYFPNKILKVHDLNFDIILKNTQSFFNRTTKGLSTEMMETVQVYEKLLSFYSKNKARALWLFYQAYFDKDLSKRKLLLDTYRRESIWYNLKQISQAGIGLPKSKKLETMNLQIPSQYVIN